MLEVCRRTAQEQAPARRGAPVLSAGASERRRRPRSAGLRQVSDILHHHWWAAADPLCLAGQIESARAIGECLLFDPDALEHLDEQIRDWSGLAGRNMTSSADTTGMAGEQQW